MSITTHGIHILPGDSVRKMPANSCVGYIT